MWYLHVYKYKKIYNISVHAPRSCSPSPWYGLSSTSSANTVLLAPVVLALVILELVLVMVVVFTVMVVVVVVAV